MSSKKAEGVRAAYFDAARYARGDGMHQDAFNRLKRAGNNTRFNWLYEIYSLWHLNRVFMSEDTMLERARRASVDMEFAQHVAMAVFAACRRINNLSSALACDKAALLDLLLNERRYWATTVQVVGAAAELMTRLDGFMDTLLFHLQEEAAITPLPREAVHMELPLVFSGVRMEDSARFVYSDSESAPSSPRSGACTPPGSLPGRLPARRASSGALPMCTSPKSRMASPKTPGSKGTLLNNLTKRLSLSRGAPVDTPRSPRSPQ